MNLETLGSAAEASLCVGCAIPARIGPDFRSKTDVETIVGGLCGLLEEGGGAKEGESTIIDGICAPRSGARTQGLSAGADATGGDEGWTGGGPTLVDVDAVVTAGNGAEGTRRGWPLAVFADGGAACRGVADTTLGPTVGRVRSTTTCPVGSLGEDRSSVASGVVAGDSYDETRGAGFRAILKREVFGFAALAGNGAGAWTEEPDVVVVAATFDPADEEIKDSFTASTGPP